MKRAAFFMNTTTTPTRETIGVALLSRALMLALAASGAALGCVAPADDSELGAEAELAEAESALVTEVCNGVDDDGDFQIDEGNVCACTMDIFDNDNPESMGGKHEYMFCNTPLDWSTARNAALAQGFDLVAIGSPAENAFLGPKVPNIGNGSWIGFTDSAQEGTWKWISGNPVSFTRWAPNEPNNANNEDCGTMWPGNATPGSTGWWNDLNCAWSNQTSIYELLDPVFWTNRGNVDVLGTWLTRSGSTGWSGGASSLSTIASGNGFVQFSTKETNLSKMAGLSNGDSDKGYGDIDYAVYLRDTGTVEVYEKGAGKGNFGPYAAGDVFRVEALDGEVRYVRNGAVFYTSAAAPVYPLLLDTSLYHVGATVGNARLRPCAGGDNACIAPGMWDNARFVMAKGDRLVRVPGNTWSAGASTFATIASGDGFVEFSTDEANLAKMAGLSNGDADTSYGDIDYAIYLTSTGTVEVYEKGAGKGSFGPYAAGDVFRVEALGGKVRYLKNGIPFYTSVTAPTYPLLLDTSLRDGGATVTSARIQSCAAGDTTCIVPGMWDNVRFVMAEGDHLTRVPGNTWTAGASTFATITSGDGFVEFSTNEEHLGKMAGLNNGDADTGYADIDYAIYLTSTGTVEVYEKGSSKGIFGTYDALDKFRVQVVNDQVSYWRVGAPAPFYTSLTTPAYPLCLDTSLRDGDATITNAKIGTL